MESTEQVQSELANLKRTLETYLPEDASGQVSTFVRSLLESIPSGPGQTFLNLSVIEEYWFPKNEEIARATVDFLEDSPLANLDGVRQALCRYRTNRTTGERPSSILQTILDDPELKEQCSRVRWVPSRHMTPKTVEQAVLFLEMLYWNFARDSSPKSMHIFQRMQQTLSSAAYLAETDEHTDAVILWKLRMFGLHHTNMPLVDAFFKPLDDPGQYPVSALRPMLSSRIRPFRDYHVPQMLTRRFAPNSPELGELLTQVTVLEGVQTMSCQALQDVIPLIEKLNDTERNVLLTTATFCNGAHFCALVRSLS